MAAAGSDNPHCVQYVQAQLSWNDCDTVNLLRSLAWMVKRIELSRFQMSSTDGWVRSARYSAP